MKVIILFSLIVVTLGGLNLPPTTEMAANFFNGVNTETETTPNHITHAELMANFNRNYDINGDKFVTNVEFMTVINKIADVDLHSLEMCLWEEYDISQDRLLTEKDFEEMLYFMDIQPQDGLVSLDEFVKYFSEMLDRAIAKSPGAGCS